MLTMTLMDTVGVQQSIITDELEDDEDGIEAWAALISHFEYSTEDLRAEALYHAWDKEELKDGEHPDVLWAKLTSIQRKLHKLNEECSDKALMRKFVSGIQRLPDNPYNNVIASYKSQLVIGKPYTPIQIRELLGLVYKESKENSRHKNMNMKGFIALKTCQVCKKNGHTKENCWVEHPEKRPKGQGMKKTYTKNSKQPQVTCWKCGRQGHRQKDCKMRDDSENSKTGNGSCYDASFQKHP